MIGGIVVFWTLAAPISERAVVTRYVVQVVPWVKGKVLSIPAKPNVPLKKGSVLFQIDPAPFQDAVNQAQGQWKVAKSNVEELQAAVNVAKASRRQSQGQLGGGVVRLRGRYEAGKGEHRGNLGIESCAGQSELRGRAGNLAAGNVRLGSGDQGPAIGRGRRGQCQSPIGFGQVQSIVNAP